MGAEEKTASASTTTAKTSDKRKGTDSFSGKAIGKKNTVMENFVVMGEKKKKANKKKQEKKLIHPMDILQSFALLKINAPTKLDGATETLKATEEKRAYYDVLPRQTKAEKEVAAAAAKGKKNPKEKATKNPTKVNVANDELFPTLPGAKSPAIKEAQAGPSAVELVKSTPSSPT